MFLVAGRKTIFDYDLELLRELTNLLDKRLDALDQDIRRCPDPDAFGLFDSAEGVCGLGFVACQQYLTTTASELGVEKAKALPCGPIHSCGDTIVSIVNHAANYWKHRDEWALGTSEKQQRKTQEGLESVLADFEVGYPLTVTLARLVEPIEAWRFRHLFPFLEHWRDDLYERYCNR